MSYVIVLKTGKHPQYLRAADSAFAAFETTVYAETGLRLARAADAGAIIGLYFRLTGVRLEWEIEPFSPAVAGSEVGEG